MTYAGGMRYANINKVMTDSLKEIIYLNEGNNENRYRDYFRLDAKINYTKNTKKVTHELGLDIVKV